MRQVRKGTRRPVPCPWTCCSPSVYFFGSDFSLFFPSSSSPTSSLPSHIIIHRFLDRFARTRFNPIGRKRVLSISPVHRRASRVPTTQRPIATPSWWLPSTHKRPTCHPEPPPKPRVCVSTRPHPATSTRPVPRLQTTTTALSTNSTEHEYCYYDRVPYQLLLFLPLPPARQPVPALRPACSNPTALVPPSSTLAAFAERYVPLRSLSAYPPIQTHAPPPGRLTTRVIISLCAFGQEKKNKGNGDPVLHFLKGPPRTPPPPPPPHNKRGTCHEPHPLPWDPRRTLASTCGSYFASTLGSSPLSHRVFNILSWSRVAV